MAIYNKNEKAIKGYKARLVIRGIDKMNPNEISLIVEWLRVIVRDLDSGKEKYSKMFTASY